MTVTQVDAVSGPYKAESLGIWVQGETKELEIYNVHPSIKRDPTRSVVVNESKCSKLKKTIEIQLVRPTEVSGKVLIEKNGYKYVKTALLLSNVFDANHQNSCLFTDKGHFSSPLWVLIGVLAKFHE